MAEDDRASLSSLLVPTTLIAVLLQLFFGVSSNVDLGRQSAPDSITESAGSPDYLDGANLLAGHLKREWLGHGDPELAGVEFLVATVPDPVLSRLDYTFDRYVDALQRAVEAAGYRLDRFDLPWARAKSQLDAQISYTGGHDPNALGPAFAQHPGVLFFTKRDRTWPVTGLLLYLVGETPTSGVNQTALTRALSEIASLCWERPAPAAPVAGTCKTHTIKLLTPSFSGSRRSLEIALAEWPGTVRHLTPGHPYDIISGSVTGIAELAGLPKGTLRSTSLPDAAFLTGVITYLTQELGASCDEIAFLTESSGFGQSLRRTLATMTTNDRDPCRALSLTFPLHLAELRREADRTRLERARDGTGKPDAATPHLPLNGNNGPIDRTVVGLMSSDEAASSELVLQDLLSAISRERIRYVGLISTDVRDRLFLASEVARHAPNTVLFMYGADVLYLHSSYNTLLRGALVVTPYPLFGLNQLWTAPFDGREHRVVFPVNAAQGVYNAALALLGCESMMLEYHRPFYPNQPDRRPALWLTTVGRSQFVPVALLSFNENLTSPVYWTSDYAQPFSQASCGDRKGTDAATSLLSANLASERGLVPDLTATVMFALTLLAGGLAFAALLTCIHHVRSALHGCGAELAVRNRRLDVAIQWLWLSRDRQFDEQRWRCALVLMASVTMAYGLSVAIYWLPVSALRALPHVTSAGVDGLTASRLIALGVLMLLLVATAVVAMHPFTLRLAERPGANQPSAPTRRPWAHAGLILTMLPGGALAAALAYGWYYLSDVPQERGEEQLLLYVRAADLTSGASPLLPLLLVSATAVLWAVCEWRRLHLTDDLSALKSLGNGQTETVPFLDVSRSSLRSVSEIEGSIRRTVTERLSELPRFVTIPVFLTFAFVVGRVWFEATWSIDGVAFDLLWWLAFGLTYFFLFATFVRAACALTYLRRMLRHLMHHPIRTSFGELQKVHGRSLRVDPARSRGTTSVLALTIEHAARTTGALPLPMPGRDALSTHVREAAVALRDSLLSEATHRWAAVGVERRQAHARMSAASGIIAELLDQGRWRLRTAPAAARRAARAELALVTAGSAGSPTIATEPELAQSPYLDPDPGGRSDWGRQAELMLACRIADFINHVVAVLRHLSIFVTFGLILMLLATASYPFQPRELLLALNWSIIGTIVVVSLTAIVQLGRDPILADLSGSQQSLLNRDTLVKVFIYGALPILSLLGVQFPEIFNRIMPWLTSTAGGN